MIGYSINAILASVNDITFLIHIPEKTSKLFAHLLIVWLGAASRSNLGCGELWLILHMSTLFSQIQLCQ